jgi:hypothetical protein
MRHLAWKIYPPGSRASLSNRWTLSIFWKFAITPSALGERRRLTPSSTGALPYRMKAVGAFQSSSPVAADNAISKTTLRILAVKPGGCIFESDG